MGCCTSNIRNLGNSELPVEEREIQLAEKKLMFSHKKLDELMMQTHKIDFNFDILHLSNLCDLYKVLPNSPTGKFFENLLRKKCLDNVQLRYLFILLCEITDVPKKTYVLSDDKRSCLAAVQELLNTALEVIPNNLEGLGPGVFKYITSLKAVADAYITELSKLSLNEIKRKICESEISAKELRIKMFFGLKNLDYKSENINFEETGYKKIDRNVEDLESSEDSIVKNQYLVEIEEKYQIEESKGENIKGKDCVVEEKRQGFEEKVSLDENVVEKQENSEEKISLDENIVEKQENSEEKVSLDENVVEKQENSDKKEEKIKPVEVLAIEKSDTELKIEDKIIEDNEKEKTEGVATSGNSVEDENLLEKSQENKLDIESQPKLENPPISSDLQSKSPTKMPEDNLVDFSISNDSISFSLNEDSLLSPLQPSEYFDKISETSEDINKILGELDKKPELASSKIQKDQRLSRISLKKDSKITQNKPTIDVNKESLKTANIESKMKSPTGIETKKSLLKEPKSPVILANKEEVKVSPKKESNIGMKKTSTNEAEKKILDTKIQSGSEKVLQKSLSLRVNTEENKKREGTERRGTKVGIVSQKNLGDEEDKKGKEGDGVVGIKKESKIASFGLMRNKP
ncbi:hypothetical protein SteCoe_27819 [Stentor coeruleus]|uniref:Uncharacterized protein n=1 Tax=Stentor coeruleus TaxID=5963 RepID=A0A1R2B9P4_9CILI|nr:hypothetical protein SteCoe_27819 [Stentor coeruleus]